MEQLQPPRVATAAPSPTPAMDAFLAMPELLEALFLECDMRDVLTSAQRVCKLWHGIVTTSPSVQVHLFFRPARVSRLHRDHLQPAFLLSPPKSAGKERSMSEASISSNDTALSSSSTSRWTTSTTSSANSAKSDTHISSHQAAPSSPPIPTLNPLLASLFPPFFRPLSASLAQQTYNSRSAIESLPLAQLPDPFLHVDASWRRMLVQQPPCESMGVSMPETGYSVLYSRQHQQRRAREWEEKRARGAVESVPLAASSTRAEGKCNSTGSCIHGRLRSSRQPSASGTDPANTAKQTRGATPAQEEEHDGLIRMWDLYDAVVRGLADPGLRWMVLWRPGVPSAGVLEPDFFRSDRTENKDRRDLEAQEYKLNLAAWEVPAPPRTNNSNNIWDPTTIHDLLDPTATTTNNNGPLAFPASSGREDLLGGCTTELMKRGAELIVVRRRDISEGAFMGWSQFRHFQGRYVNPRWLAAGMVGSSSGGGGGAVGGNASLERIGGGGRIVVTGAPTRSHRREL